MEECHRNLPMRVLFCSGVFPQPGVPEGFLQFSLKSSVRVPEAVGSPGRRSGSPAGATYPRMVS